jgi:hypothetical protein
MAAISGRPHGRAVGRGFSLAESANETMTEKDFRRIVLALDGAIEAAHMGHPDFRAHGRIFATLRHEPTTFGVVMLTAEQQQRFVKLSRGFTPESGAWGRDGCTRVSLDDVDEDTLGEAVTLAWQNAADKSAAKTKAKKSKRAVRR